MSEIWLVFSVDTFGTFNDLSHNILNNLNVIYSLNNNIISKSSNFVIHELNPNLLISDGSSLNNNSWIDITGDYSTILNPYQSYWLGGIELTSTSLIKEAKCSVVSYYIRYISSTGKYLLYIYDDFEVTGESLSSSDVIVNALGLNNINELVNYRIITETNNIINVLTFYNEGNTSMRDIDNATHPAYTYIFEILPTIQNEQNIIYPWNYNVNNPFIYELTFQVKDFYL